MAQDAAQGAAPDAEVLAAGADAADTADRVRRDLASTARVEAFSDGVIAVAITLLILGVRKPEPASDSWALDLLRNWPDYAAYLVSFATVGIIWVNHHAVFSLIERVDRAALFLNLGLLLTVTLIPFSTSLLQEALVAGSNERAAACVYSLSLLLMGLAFGGLFVYALGRAELRARRLAPIPPAVARRFTAGSVAYAAATGLALVHPAIALAIDGALAVYYAALRIEAT